MRIENEKMTWIKDNDGQLDRHTRMVRLTRKIRPSSTSEISEKENSSVV
jgi:hypothetical protein